MTSEKVLVLRTCKYDMTSRNGFVWPTRGYVECPDWSPEPKCGHGLYGLLWGQGRDIWLNWSPDAVWLVVEVDADQIVDLGDKVKFPRGNVVFCGEQMGATDYIAKRAPVGTQVVGVVGWLHSRC